MTKIVKIQLLKIPRFFSSYAGGEDLLADGWVAAEEQSDDLRLIVTVMIALMLDCTLFFVTK